VGMNDGVIMKDIMRGGTSVTTKYVNSKKWEVLIYFRTKKTERERKKKQHGGKIVRVGEVVKENTEKKELNLQRGGTTYLWPRQSTKPLDSL